MDDGRLLYGASLIIQVLRTHAEEGKHATFKSMEYRMK